MNMVLNRAWKDFPDLRQHRAKRFQVAALCHRPGEDGCEYLLITSRRTKRWIIPKGWPIDGLSDGNAALQEAWEEAGVSAGRLDEAPLGTFTYNKTKANGWFTPVRTTVFSVQVEAMKDHFPEHDQRTRLWVPRDTAAELLSDPGLADILRARPCR